MLRAVLTAIVLSGAAAGVAQAQDAAKKEYCKHQGAIVAALAQARIDRIPERKAEAHVLETASWPDKYNPAVPIYVGEIYKLKRRDLKKVDLGAQWEEACLAN